MKKLTLQFLSVFLVAILSYWGFQMYNFGDGVKEDAKILTLFKVGGELQSGDIIFQTSTSGQSKAIQLATGSPYNHMGIIYQNGADFFVYEAVQPVKLTPLSHWIDRGEGGHFVVKRLKNADKILTSNSLKEMREIGERFKGRPYDLYFEWSDERIYCSELVWKIYKEATGIEIGELETLGDFDLTNEAVVEKLKERYGSNIPLSEKVISPGAMFQSHNLKTVVTN